MISTPSEHSDNLAPAREGRAPGSRKFLRPVAVIAFLVLAAAGVALAIFLDKWYSPMAGGRFEGNLVVIEMGDSPRAIGTKLADQGLIDDPFQFEFYVRLTGAASAIQAGTYELGTTTSLADLVQMAVGGASVSTDITVTIVEGLTVQAQGRIFEAAGLFTAEEYEKAAVMSDYYSDFWILGDLEPGDSLIGYLFPDTYRFRPNTLPQRAVQRLLSRAQEQLQSIGITSTGRSVGRMRNLHQILTFASIVQTESPAGEEPFIAGVFYNRLQNGWRFESDATVNFILGTSKLIPSATDIRVDSPYNTYKISGLPPGPINSPGLRAIRATLEPEKHQWFFFLHTPEGVTVPSRTFEEHLRNRAKYWE